ncbi:MAG: DegT/DnrJ/EryC1/StrS family aminotransferase [bacterium]
MISVNEPKIPKNAIKYVTDAVSSGWISSAGKYVDDFETSFAKYIGVNYATTCSNGTTSIQLALSSLGLKEGDEVIIPNLTIISCALACVYLGLRPVVVDVERDTFNIDISKIEEKITSKTKAIMPVHLYGQCCDMDKVLIIAKNHNLYVVEDAAEAIGAEYKSKRAGSMGDFGSFSLYANKLVTCGEGGILTTNDENLYERAKTLKNLAHFKGKRFWHEEIGYNFRMTNMQAALALASLEEAKESLKHKQDMAGWYNEGLKDVEGLTIPKTADYNNVHSYWMYALIVEEGFGISRDALMARLKEEYQIDTRSFFYSINEQPALGKYFKDDKSSYPVSKELSEKGFYLPSGLTLTEFQADKVVSAIRDIKSKV